VDLLLLAVVGLTVLALLFDFSNGFHDAANSIATVVATKAMPAKMAVWFSAACNFAAYFFVGTAVANTVAKIVDPRVDGVAVVFAALTAAIIWNYVTWYVGMPSSSSHAVIGGLVGAGLAAGGAAAVDWSAVRKAGLWIVLSPIVAIAAATVATAVVWGIQRATGWGDDARPFKGLQLISAAAVSFGHGANDAQKTMGMIAALLAASGYVAVPEGGAAIPVPEWVALLAYTAIALGTIWGGWRIIETVGLRLTELNPRTGAAANVGASAAIFGATSMGIPISTTHAAASSVVGAGLAAGKGARWRVVGTMVTAWAVTIPSAAAVSWIMFHLTQGPTAFSVPVISGLLLAIGAGIVWAMLHSIGAKEVEAALASGPKLPEVPVTEPTPASALATESAPAPISALESAPTPTSMSAPASVPAAVSAST
jgi:inorganic phosphate transporter, PiT family